MAKFRRYDVAKKRILASVLIVFIIVLGIITAESSKQDSREWTESIDSMELTPNNEADWQPYEDGDVKLDFQKKQLLAKARFRRKYGFRRELIIDKPTAFMQYMPPTYNMDHIRFGIYRDKNLADPIDEADAGYNYNADWHIEEGADPSEYPEYKTRIQVILEPGIYYVAVYTTSKWDKGEFLYRSWYDVIDSDLTLKEGEYQYFYAEPGKEYEFPFAVADNAKIVLETIGIAGTLTLYDTDGKTALETLDIAADQPYKGSKKHFSFEQGGTYYFRLTNYPEELYIKKIREYVSTLNKNWLRYKGVK